MNTESLADLIKSAFLHAASNGGLVDDATMYRMVAERLRQHVVAREAHDHIVETHRQLLESEREQYRREIRGLRKILERAGIPAGFFLERDAAYELTSQR